MAIGNLAPRLRKGISIVSSVLGICIVGLLAVASAETGGTCTGGSNGVVGGLDCVGGCQEAGWSCGPEIVDGRYKTCACDADSTRAPPVSKACCHFAWKKDEQGKFSIPATLGDCPSCPLAGECYVDFQGVNGGCFGATTSLSVSQTQDD